MTQTMTDEYGSPDKAANTVAYDCLVGPDHIDGRITHGGGMLLFTFRLSRNFEFEKIVLDNPGSMSEDGLIIYKRIVSLRESGDRESKRSSAATTAGSREGCWPGGTCQ